MKNIKPSLIIVLILAAVVLIGWILPIFPSIPALTRLTDSKAKELFLAYKRLANKDHVGHRLTEKDLGHMRSIALRLAQAGYVIIEVNHEENGAGHLLVKEDIFNSPLPDSIWAEIKKNYAQESGVIEKEIFTS